MSDERVMTGYVGMSKQTFISRAKQGIEHGFGFTGFKETKHYTTDTSQLSYQVN